MRFKVILILLILLVGLTGSLVAYYKISSETSSPDNKPSPISLVTIPNEQVKSEFLRVNNLAESDLKATPELKNTYIVEVPNNKLKGAGAAVSPRREYQALITPNDPNYPQWYTDKISAPAAWDITTGDSRYTAAVIDTGFGLLHEDMADRWFVNPGEYGGGKESNGIDDDGNSKVDDWRGWDFIQNDNNPNTGSLNPSGRATNHGTIVAGLVSTAGNNSIGVASINWGSRILPLQVLNDSGSGFTEDVTAAINYAVAIGVKVVNLSLGTTGHDPILENAINNAINSGVTIVAAAGNCGDPATYINNGCNYVGQMVYPAKYTNVIAVGASDQNDQRAAFSSYGPELDILAPGSGAIKAPSWSQANQTSLYTGNIYGTSFAAPIVAGLINLGVATAPSASPADINQFLTMAASKVPDMAQQDRTDKHGYGRSDAYLFLRALHTLHPDGILIKPSDSASVYLIEDGHKIPIPSPQVFESQGFSWSRIKRATFADMALPNGTKLDFKEGVPIKGSDATVYITDFDNGLIVKRPVVGAKNYLELGYSFSNDEMITVVDTQLPSGNGSPIDSSLAHPDGTLIKPFTSDSVYLIENSQKRPIPSPQVFESQGFGWGKIKTATAYDLTLPNGPTLNFREGTLIKGSTPTVYAVNYLGPQIEKRPIASSTIFTLLGFSFSNEIILVGDANLPAATSSSIQ